MKLLFVLVFYLSLVHSQFNTVFSFGDNSNFNDAALGFDRTIPNKVNTVEEVTSVAAGYGLHSLFISKNQLFGFGTNINSVFTDTITSDVYTPTNIPLNSTAKPMQVAAGFHSVVLMNNGQVFTFGLNDFGQLCQNNTFTSGQPSLVKLNENVTKVVAGEKSTFLITRTGNLYACGNNENNQLGVNPVNITITIPTLVNVGESVKDVANIQGHTLVLGNSGKVYSIGLNQFGQLGINSNNTMTNFQQVLLNNTQNATQVAVGKESSYILLSTGEVYVFGRNNRGQLGTGPVSFYSVPTFLITNVEFISSGNDFFIFINKYRQVYATGTNANSQLGIGKSNDGAGTPTFISSLPTSNSFLSCGSVRTLFVTIQKSYLYVSPGNEVIDQRMPYPLLTLSGNITKAYTGNAYTLFEQSDKQIFASGNNNNGGSIGVLGMSSFVAQQYAPVSISVSSNYQEISTGLSHVLILYQNGSVSSHGGNQYGQLGYNTSYGANFTTDKSNLTPKIIDLVSGFTITQVSAGGTFSLLLTNNSRVISFGNNLDGQLGINNTNIRDTYLPQFILLGGNVKISKIFAGIVHSFALATDGTLYGWGRCNRGELRFPCGNQIQLFPRSINVNFTKNVYIGSTDNQKNGFTIVTTITDEIYVFGANTYGQLCNKNQIDQMTPINAQPFLSNITQISLGEDFSLFLRTDGKVQGCGKNSNGQLGFPDSKNRTSPDIIQAVFNVNYISAGLKHSVIINRCPAGFSGPQCTSTVCFGVSSLSQTVCSGEGLCMVAERCSCFSPSFGDTCQFGEYHFRPELAAGSKWSKAENWYVKRGDLLLLATQAPTDVGDSVYFDIPTSVQPVVDVDVSNLVLGSLFVGSPRTNVSSEVNATLNFAKTNLVLNNALSIKEGSTLTLGAGSSMTLVTSQIYGQMKLSGVSLFGNIVSFSSSSLDIIDSTINPKTVSISGKCQIKNSQINGDLNTQISSFVSIINSTISSDTTSIQGSVTFSKSNFQSKTVGSRATITFNVGVVTYSGSMENANLNVFSVMNFDNSTFTNTTVFLNSQSNILNNAVVTLSKSNITIGSKNLITNMYGSIISNDKDSIIRNQGTFNIISLNNTNVTLGSPFQNLNTLNIQSLNSTKGVINLLSTFDCLPQTYINIYNSKINAPNGLMILQGTFLVSGEITTSNLVYRSFDGFMKLLPPNILIINGNFVLDEQSSIFLVSNGTQDSQSDIIKVNGLFNMTGGFILVKCGKGFTPEIGQNIPFINAKQIIASKSEITTYLSGAPFKTAELNIGSTSVSFDTVSSFGSVSQAGYQCNYLGEKKVLETNVFAKQKRVMISFTVPSFPNAIGFGFDFNKTFSQSPLFIANSSDIQSFSHNNTLLQSGIIDYSITLSQSIFNIGPLYYTMNIFFNLPLLDVQNYLYYTEFNDMNGTKHTKSQTINFKISDFLVTPKAECTNFAQPARSETFAPAAMGVVLGIYVIIFVICLIFSRFRPLNTRGISPFLTLIFIFIQLILEIKNHFVIPDFQGSLCTYLIYGIFPLQQICFIMIYLYFLRYFSIINLNQNKKDVSKMFESGVTISPWFKFKNRFFKFFSSSFVTIFLIFFSYISLFIFYTIIFATTRFQCTFSILLIMKILNNVGLIFIYALTIITFLIDLIPNFQLIIRFKWIQYVFYSDPYWFRAQIFIFFPFLIYTLCVELYFVANTYSYSLVIKNHKLESIMNTITAALLLIIDVLLPLIITIIELIRTRFKKKMDPISTILNDKVSEQLFYNYCETEFSVENMISYRDIVKYKNEPTEDFAKEVFQKYFNGRDSVLEVNTSRQNCNEISQKLARNEIKPDLFDKVEKDIFMNLSETYTRFVISSDWKAHLNSVKTQKELIEGK